MSDNSDEAAEHDRGWSLFESGEPQSACRTSWQERGWAWAAWSLGRRCRESPVTPAAPTAAAELRTVLGQAGAAIRALQPAKPTPAQRRLAEAALTDIGNALAALGDGDG